MAEGDWSVVLRCPCIMGGGVLRSGEVRIYEGTGAGSAHRDLFLGVGVLRGEVGVVSISGE